MRGNSSMFNFIIRPITLLILSSFYIQISSAKKKEIKEEMKEPEGPKFQAFTGRKYSLRD
jgi:hypothetical protein